MSDVTLGGTTLTPNPELSEPALDLSRPELAQVMDRYVSPAVAGPRPVALIVERPGLPSLGLKEALANDGWTVRTCSGPSGATCPLTVGAPCELREEADAAIVYVDQRAPSAANNTLPRLRCASHPA